MATVSAYYLKACGVCLFVPIMYGVHSQGLQWPKMAVKFPIVLFTFVFCLMIYAIWVSQGNKSLFWVVSFTDIFANLLSLVPKLFFSHEKNSAGIFSQFVTL